MHHSKQQLLNLDEKGLLKDFKKYKSYQYYTEFDVLEDLYLVLNDLKEYENQLKKLSNKKVLAQQEKYQFIHKKQLSIIQSKIKYIENSFKIKLT